MQVDGPDLRLGPFWYTGPDSRSNSVTAQGRFARMGRSRWMDHDLREQEEGAPLLILCMCIGKDKRVHQFTALCTFVSIHS